MLLEQITEEMLAKFFSECGAVMDVRVCGACPAKLTTCVLSDHWTGAASLVNNTLDRYQYNGCAGRA